MSMGRIIPKAEGQSTHYHLVNKCIMEFLLRRLLTTLLITVELNIETAMSVHCDLQLYKTVPIYMVLVLFYGYACT